MWLIFVIKSHDNQFNLGSYLFSSFTLLYVLNRAVTGMRLTISYT